MVQMMTKTISKKPFKLLGYKFVRLEVAIKLSEAEFLEALNRRQLEVDRDWFLAFRNQFSQPTEISKPGELANLIIEVKVKEWTTRENLQIVQKFPAREKVAK